MKATQLEKKSTFFKICHGLLCHGSPAEGTGVENQNQQAAQRQDDLFCEYVHAHNW